MNRETNNQSKLSKHNCFWTCSKYGEEERHVHGFGRETGGKETTWETQA